MKYKLDNRFYADDIDITTFDYPEVKVVSWNTIIGSTMGSYHVEPPSNDKLNYLYLTIKEYDVFSGDNLKKVRSKALATARRFNKNLKKNWDDVLLDAFKKCLKYYEEKSPEEKEIPTLMFMAG